MNDRFVVCMAIREKWITRAEYKTVASSYQLTHCLKRGLWILMWLHHVRCFSALTSSALPPLPQALVLKVGMDSIMASYFALFEVINHSFGKGCICARSTKMKLGSALARSHMRDFRSPLSGDFITWTLFLNKDPNRPAGEFNCSPGERMHACVCVCGVFISKGR